MSEASHQPLLSANEKRESEEYYNGEAAKIAPAAPNRMMPPAAPGKTNQEYKSLLESINVFQDVYDGDVLTANPFFYYGLLSNITVNKEGGTITPAQADQLYAALSEKPVYKGKRLKKRIMATALFFP